MTERQKAISEDFSRELLRALYGLDAHIGKLDKICSSVQDEAVKAQFVGALGDLMGDIHAKLMRPIYGQHPALGSPYEPGPWLRKVARQKGREPTGDGLGDADGVLKKTAAAVIQALKVDRRQPGRTHAGSSQDSAMPDVFVTPAAAEKILRDKEIFVNLRGPNVVPRLDYYVRSYSTFKDGQIVEHGDGLVLSFVDPSGEMHHQDYVRIEIEGGVAVLLGPADHFRKGLHSIDWRDRTFKLTTSDWQLPPFLKDDG